MLLLRPGLSKQSLEVLDLYKRGYKHIGVNNTDIKGINYSKLTQSLKIIDSSFFYLRRFNILSKYINDFCILEVIT